MPSDLTAAVAREAISITVSASAAVAATAPGGGGPRGRATPMDITAVVSVVVVLVIITAEVRRRAVVASLPMSRVAAATLGPIPLPGALTLLLMAGRMAMGPTDDRTKIRVTIALPSRAKPLVLASLTTARAAGTRTLNQAVISERRDV